MIIAGVVMVLLAHQNKFEKPKAPSLEEDRNMGSKEREISTQRHRLWMFFNEASNVKDMKIFPHEQAAIEKALGDDAFTHPEKYLTQQKPYQLIATLST